MKLNMVSQMFLELLLGKLSGTTLVVLFRDQSLLSILLHIISLNS
jgi:hypothetical protein